MKLLFWIRKFFEQGITTRVQNTEKLPIFWIVTKMNYKLDICHYFIRNNRKSLVNYILFYFIEFN